MPKTLSVVMAHNTPFYFQKLNETEYGGVDTSVINALSQGLRSNISIQRSSIRNWGSCSTDSCTGMIGMLQRNECDIAMSGMTMTYDRHQHVDFSFPYLLDRLTFMVRAPEPLDPASVIIKPFSVEVWVFLFAAVVTLMIVRQTTKLMPPHFHGFLTLLDIHGLLLGKGLQHLPELLSQRIVVWSWLVLSLVLSTSYSGVLFSSMAHSGLEDVVDSIPELTKALQKKEIVCGTLKNTHLEKSLQEDKPLKPFAKAILASLEKGVNYVSSDVVGVQRCLKGRFAYIGEYIGVLADVEDIGAITFAKDSFQMGLYGVALKRHLNLSEHVNDVILHLWDAGLVQFWLENATYNSRRRTHDLGPEVLNVRRMRGPLNILWGLPISFVTLWIEKSIRFFRVRRSRLLLATCPVPLPVVHRSFSLQVASNVAHLKTLRRSRGHRENT